MYAFEDFYYGYLVNHYDYRQLTNEYLLNLDDREILEICENVYGRSVDDFKRSIVADIRYNALMSIETLFELVFALLPDENGLIHDRDIINKLSEVEFYNNDIRSFEKGDSNKLDKLDAVITDLNGEKCTVIKHIFYFNYYDGSDESKIEESLVAIKKALKLFSSEISQRVELNSFKHGLRGIQGPNMFSIYNHKTKKPIVRFDIDHSLSLYSKKKDGSHHFVNKVLDPKRDLKISMLASNLIGNVINLRKGLAQSRKEQTEVMISFINDQTIEDVARRNIPFSEFTVSFKPVTVN